MVKRRLHCKNKTWTFRLDNLSLFQTEEHSVVDQLYIAFHQDWRSQDIQHLLVLYQYGNGHPHHDEKNYENAALSNLIPKNIYQLTKINY